MRFTFVNQGHFLQFSKKLVLICVLLILSVFMPRAEAGRLKDYNNQKNVYVTEWSKLKHLAEQGDPDALFTLGNFYFQPPKGSSFKQNYKKAAELYFQSSIRENASAQYNIAIMLYRGLGFKQDIIEAYSWFYLASVNESPVAKHINRKTASVVEQIKIELTDEQLNDAEARIANYQQIFQSKRYREAKLPSQH